MQEEVADYYGIPSIHLGVAVSQLVSDGKLIFTSSSDVSIPGAVIFTHDSIHPTIPEGHQIYTDTITRSFEKMRELRDHVGKVEHHLPQDLLVPANPWEYATMLPLDRLTHFSAGWSYVTSNDFALVREYDWLFPGLWRAVDPGEAITVEFEGTHIGLFDIGGPDSGRLKVSVDGGSPLLSIVSLLITIIIEINMFSCRSYRMGNIPFASRSIMRRRTKRPCLRLTAMNEVWRIFGSIQLGMIKRSSSLENCYWCSRHYNGLVQLEE